MRAVGRVLADLLDQVLELVEWRAFAGREVMKGATVRSRPEVTRRQSPLRSLLGSGPGLPPVAAELGELVQRGRAVDERAQLPDRLAPERLDAAIGDHREAVGQLE